VLHNTGANSSVYMLILVCFYLYFNYLPLFFQILNVKPGDDDYLDTSFLLRQASPYMKIKYYYSPYYTDSFSFLLL